MSRKSQIQFLAVLAGVLLLLLLSACQAPTSTGEPVPPKAVRMIRKLDARIASLSKYSPKIVMAETMVIKAAEKRGQVGDVCEALEVVSPGLERELRQLQNRPTSEEKQTITVLKDVIRGFSEVEELLECPQTAAQ
jgi:hypothetical protein